MIGRKVDISHGLGHGCDTQPPLVRNVMATVGELSRAQSFTARQHRPIEGLDLVGQSLNI
jgi:hypothetical protein